MVSFPKIIIMSSLALFTVIGCAAIIKKKFSSPPVCIVEKSLIPTFKLDPSTQNLSFVQKKSSQEAFKDTCESSIPIIDRIDELFKVGSKQLPIVETIVYKSHVPWLKGKPAWIGDYASHFSTSRHFIARSLNGKPDYFAQKISIGSRFNVFRKDKNIQFYLVASVLDCKMAFYYLDADTNERVLLKVYPIGLGKQSSTPSGSLTPTGTYSLGDKIAVYKPGIMGFFQDKQVEMIQVFGTRWMPFGKSLDRSIPDAKGFGIQGAPWFLDPKSGKWVESRKEIGNYSSDGCIRMNFEDLEELFSIVITKPTVIEIVKQFKDAKLPGIEVTSPKR